MVLSTARCSIVDPLQRLSYNWGVGGGEVGRASMGGALDVDSSGGRHPRSHGAVRLPSRSAGSVSGCKIWMAEIHRQPGACRWGVGMTTKAKSIVYWTTTDTHSVFYRKRRRCSTGACAGHCRWLCAHPWLPGVLCDHPGSFGRCLEPLPYSCRVFRGSRNGHMPASSLT